MDTQMKGAAKRLILSLLVAVSASGCAYYGPPYAAYDTNYYGYSQPYYGSRPYYGYSRPYYGYSQPYYGYSQPYYAGPPISLGLEFGFHEYRGGGYRGRHGWGHGHGGRGGWGQGGDGRGGGHWRGGH